MASSTKSARRRSGAPESAALDNALYTPRLDRLSMPESLLAGAGPDYGAVLESICGVTDDSQPVEQYDGSLGVTTGFVTAHQQPAAQVQWNDNLAAAYTNPGDVNGVRWGSGTMIGPDLFLTCGHLFDSDPNGWTIPRQNGSSAAISPQQVALSMHLNFLYQVDPGGTLRAEQRFPITQLIEYRLGGLDMALCRIGGNPGDTYGWTEVSATDAAVGDMLAIIGHPAGLPKRIEAGPATELGGSTIRYNDIDTLGGNSGSGILHGPTGRVVGVHTNGGCNSAGTGSNSGVAIAAIRAVSPTLQALPAGSHTAHAADSLSTAFADDVFGTALAADVVGTAYGLDTAVASDRWGTRLGDDLLGTAQAADTGLADLLGSRFGNDIGTVGAGDDPNNSLAEMIVDPGKVVFDPASPIGRFGGGLRPLVQAGPHAVLAGERADPTLAESVLAELERAIAAQTAVVASLAAVHSALGAAAGVRST